MGSFPLNNHFLTLKLNSIDPSTLLFSFDLIFQLKIDIKIRTTEDICDFRELIKTS